MYKLDRRCVFAGVLKVLAKVASCKWDEIPDAAAEACGIDYAGKSPEHLAARLVAAGMARGILDLLRPYLRQLPGTDEKPDAKLDRFLDGLREEADEITLTPDLLNNPAALPLVKAYRERLAAFLHHRGFADPEFGFTANTPTAIAARLPWFFTQGLLHEYAHTPDDYRPLDDYLKSAVGAFWQRERSWEKYRAEFNCRLVQSVFDEPYSLADVFIWPNAYHETRPKRAAPTCRGIDPEEGGKPTVRHVVALKDYLDQWLETAAGRQAYRVLAGDPGGGKSSFARMYTADRLERGDRVLYVPLHELGDIGDSFHAALDGFCKLRGYPDGLLHDDKAPDRLILVLDGLDELSNQGQAGETAARRFAEKVMREVNLRNGAGKLRVAVLFCGRPIPVQQVSDLFCEPGQVLKLLPYAVTKGERERKALYYYDDPRGLLGVFGKPGDLRAEWWKQYARVALGDVTHPLPDYFGDERFEELTAQPMNNHAIAIVRDRVNPADPGFSMNAVFNELIRKVYDRRWADPHAPRDAAAPGHKTTRPLAAGADHETGFATFRSLMSVLGQAAWHGGTDRVTTVADFERLCDPAGLSGLLEEYRRKFEEGSLGLFTAFYVRYAGVAGATPKFEFTQKRFGEYLAAVRLVEVVAEFAARLGGPKDPYQPHGAKFEARDLLLKWLVAAGPAAVTPDMMPYINDEVRIRAAESPGLADRWQELTVSLLNATLAHGMPCEDLTEAAVGRRLAYRDMVEYARNAEEALLVLHGAAAWVTRTMSNVHWPKPTSAGELIHRLRGQRDGPDNRAVFYSLHNLEFSYKRLDFIDLYMAMLDGANLTMATLYSASLIRANLRGARLDGASLDEARLDGANLRGASLIRANLRGARLDGANLSEAHLDEARLDGARLDGASLDGASLDGAILTKATLKRANLTGAVMDGLALDTPKGLDLLRSRGAIL